VSLDAQGTEGFDTGGIKGPHLDLMRWRKETTTTTTTTTTTMTTMT
jgi:hypothetical protein